MKKLLIRTGLCLLLALLGCAAWALAEGSFEAVVTADGMNVYAQTAPHALVGTLPKGTTVTVLEWSGKAALVSGGGLSGIARVSDMTRAAVQTPAPQTMVTNRRTRVYMRPNATSRYAVLNAGVTLQVLSLNGGYAQVSLNGNVGYMIYAHLSQPGAPASTPMPTATPAPVGFDAQYGSVPVATLLDTEIYENPDYSGQAVTVRKGFRMTLLAVRGECAMVTRDGAIGYVPLACLKKDGAAETPKPGAPSKANPFDAGSNEYVIFDFLVNDMDLNRAAAMGVMANIYFESSYRPVINGDGGTSYGICQWHAGRKTNLINWCTEHGLDYTTLQGQLKFLQYELPTRYPSVDNYIRQVENTADGAYDAAYYFCFNFEAPANRTAQSTKRGNYARDTLFPKK